MRKVHADLPPGIKPGSAHIRLQLYSLQGLADCMQQEWFSQFDKSPNELPDSFLSLMRLLQKDISCGPEHNRAITGPGPHSPPPIKGSCNCLKQPLSAWACYFFRDASRLYYDPQVAPCRSRFCLLCIYGIHLCSLLIPNRAVAPDKMMTRRNNNMHSAEAHLQYVLCCCSYALDDC